MGKKAQWDTWRGQWPSSSSAYTWQKGAGKDAWQKGGGQDWNQRWTEEAAEVWFPSYEMMEAKPARQSLDRKSGYTEQADNDGVQTGDLMHHIQKLVNTLRKADSRLRKGEKDKEEATGKWERFQEGLKQSFVRERNKYYEKLKKIQDESQECKATKVQALSAIQDLFIGNPAEKEENGEQATKIEAEWERLVMQEDDPMEGLPGLLAAAIQSGGMAKEKAKRQMMQALGLQIDKDDQYATPPRRARASRSKTPPADKSVEGSGPPPGEGEAATPYGTAAANDDPYMTSPNVHGPVEETPLGRPKHRASGTRMNIKMMGRTPSQPRLSKTTLAEKLDSKRSKATGTEVIDEITDTDEDVPIGNLPRSHREGG